MVSRAFPVTYFSDVERAAQFWGLFGFERFYELPGGCWLMSLHTDRRGSARSPG